jgi:hypothetical protein
VTSQSYTSKYLIKHQHSKVSTTPDTSEQASMSSTSTSRQPLEPTTNDVHTSSPPLPNATAKTGPILRHKSSHHDLKPNLDSSEDYPSPHSSLYEASLIQAGIENTDTWVTQDSLAPADPTDGPASWESIIVNDLGEGVPISFLQPPSTKKTHTPHELYPITEQSSFATLRPAGSFTMKGRASTSTLRARSPGLNGKKRKSFSLADLQPIPVEEPTQESPPLSPAPRPVQPHQGPPERMPTPPGLPTFNKPEAISYRLPPPKPRWRDNCFNSSNAEMEWRKQTVGLPKGVVMRGEDGVLVRGKFIPIRSGHLPPLQAQRNTVFQTPGQYQEPEPVRVVSAQQGADMALPDWEAGRRRWKKERRERRLKRACWFIDFVLCCGLFEAGDCSAQTQNPYGGDGVAESPRERPLFVGGFI